MEMTKGRIGTMKGKREERSKKGGKEGRKEQRGREKLLIKIDGLCEGGGGAVYVLCGQIDPPPKPKEAAAGIFFYGPGPGANVR